MRRPIARDINQRKRIYAKSVSNWVPSTVSSTFNFSPLTFSPKLWLDASDSSTITSSGSPAKVSQWNDKSGNSFNVAQATSANQAVTGATTQNGLNVIDFTGVEWLSSTANFGVSNDTNFTVFAVLRYTVQSDFNTFLGTGIPGTVNRAAGFLFRNTRRPATDIWAPAGYLSDTAIDTNRTYLLTYATRPWSPISSHFIKINSVLTTGTASGTPNLGDGVIHIGTFLPAQLNTRWRGFIAEIIVYFDPLTTTQINDVELYLNNKWAVF